MSAVLKRDEGRPPVDPALENLPIALVPAPLWHRMVALVLKALLPAVILALAAWGWHAITATGPVAGRAASGVEARLVDVVAARAATAGPTVAALARAEAAQTAILSTPTAGLITDVAAGLVRHGRLSAGQTAFAIDPGDLTYELAAAEARVRQVEARIALEAGRAARAALDFERLNDEVTEAQQALILREPQMAELSGERDAAAAEVARVRTRLENMRVAAPFDALVTDASAAAGTRIGAGHVLATLVATDAFDVVLTVAVPDLAWIAIGDEVTLSRPGVWPPGVSRQATVTRIGAALAGGGSMAEVVARLEDPLALSPAGRAPPVRLGAYLTAVIQNPAIAGTVEIDRAHLRDGATVWVMDETDRLSIRQVTIVWADRQRVLIGNGLSAAERVVATPLGAFAEGMPLRDARADDSGTDAAGPDG